MTTALIALPLACYVLSGFGVVSFRLAPLRWPLFADILRVGGVGAYNTLPTTATIALTTGLVGAAAGPTGIAGYGAPARGSNIC